MDAFPPAGIPCSGLDGGHTARRSAASRLCPYARCGRARPRARDGGGKRGPSRASAPNMHSSRGCAHRVRVRCTLWRVVAPSLLQRRRIAQVDSSTPAPASSQLRCSRLAGPPPGALAQRRRCPAGSPALIRCLRRARCRRQGGAQAYHARGAGGQSSEQLQCMMGRRLRKGQANVHHITAQHTAWRPQRDARRTRVHAPPCQQAAMAYAGTRTGQAAATTAQPQPQLQ